MRKQTYLIRKWARYHFRRRLPCAGADNGALTLSLNPDEALLGAAPHCPMG